METSSVTLSMMERMQEVPHPLECTSPPQERAGAARPCPRGGGAGQSRRGGVHRPALNGSHGVVRHIWQRRSVSPLRCCAHRLQRGEPPQGLLVPMDITCDLRHTARHGASAVSQRACLWGGPWTKGPTPVATGWCANSMPNTTSSRCARLLSWVPAQARRGTRCLRSAWAMAKEGQPCAAPCPAMCQRASTLPTGRHEALS